MIVNVIEPDHGKVIDPACGSGGMFVQSAHFIEKQHGNPTEAVTFCGQEKNPTTIRLAKMNLAVHGLEGDVQKGITYYDDNHEMLGKADFVIRPNFFYTRTVPASATPPPHNTSLNILRFPQKIEAKRVISYIPAVPFC